MAVSRFVNSARARERMIDILAAPTAGMVKAARTAIIEMTTRSSIRVKAREVRTGECGMRSARCEERGAWSVERDMGFGIPRSALGIPHSAFRIVYGVFIVRAVRLPFVR